MGGGTSRQADRAQQPEGKILLEYSAKFLGFSFTNGTNLKRRLAPQTVVRFKAKVRELTRRTRGRSLAQIVKELSLYLIGWLG